MVSWEDGEYSSATILGDTVPMDYAPDTCVDPDFDGLAVGCPLLCREHKLEPNKCVAFEGTSTGRRFYMCSVKNLVENCGFVDWVDGEWPPTCKRAVGKLWGMYEDACSVALDEKILHATSMQDLIDEKNKWEKMYKDCTDDVNRFIKETSTSTMKANYERIQKEGAEHDMMEQMKLTISQLEAQVSELKNEKRSQAEVMRARKQQWEEEKEVLKAEKKKLESSLFDLFNVNAGNKDKLKKIKAICDE